MSTTIQHLYVRAKQSTPANAELIPRASEVLAVIRDEQESLFASLASVTRDRFQTTAALSSTSAVEQRVFDLSSVSPSVERVLQVVLSDGREAHQVDPLDIDAELAPRYIVRGTTLVEVSNDWKLGAGIVGATLLYVYGPTSISVSGDYTQTVSLPDAWCELLQLPLEAYFAKMRGAGDEVDALNARLAKRTDDFVTYLTNYGGIRSNRFDIPLPTPQGKK